MGGVRGPVDDRRRLPGNEGNPFRNGFQRDAHRNAMGEPDPAESGVHPGDCSRKIPAFLVGNRPADGFDPSPERRRNTHQPDLHPVSDPDRRQFCLFKISVDIIRIAVDQGENPLGITGFIVVGQSWSNRVKTRKKRLLTTVSGVRIPPGEPILNHSSPRFPIGYL